MLASVNEGEYLFKEEDARCPEENYKASFHNPKIHIEVQETTKSQAKLTLLALPSSSQDIQKTLCKMNDAQGVTISNSKPHYSVTVATKHHGTNTRDP